MFFHIYFLQTKCLKNDRTTLTQLNVSEKNPTMFLFAEHKFKSYFAWNFYMSIRGFIFFI